MEKLKICDGCLNAEATRCCKQCNECYCDECMALHYEEKHMEKYLRKLKEQHSSLS